MSKANLIVIPNEDIPKATFGKVRPIEMLSGEGALPVDKEDEIVAHDPSISYEIREVDKSEFPSEG